MESIFTIECSICFAPFSSEKKEKQPTLLDCGHTFCFECINSLSIKDHKIQCPLCLVSTTLATLTPSPASADTTSISSQQGQPAPSPFKLNSQLITILSPKPKITAMPCECKQMTDHYCPECPLEPPLCSECFSGTHLTAARKTHTLVLLSEKTSFQCSKHNQALLLYCFDDDQLICLLCGYYGDHKNHRMEPLDIAAKKLRPELTKVIQKRERMVVKINQQYIEAHQNLMNVQIKKYLLDQSESILQKCSVEKNDTLFLLMWAEVMKESVLKIHKLSFTGNIITKDNDLEKSLIPMLPEKYQYVQSTLIYRGSRDGLNGATFCKFCAHKGPTLTLLRSTRKNIFGGFTPVPWAVNNNHAEDPSLESFLFTLKNPWNGPPVKFPIISKTSAVYSGINEGPSFNFAHLRIYLPNANYCHTPGSYNFNSVSSAYHSCSLMDGGCSISIEEIEVYLFESSS